MTEIEINVAIAEAVGVVFSEDHGLWSCCGPGVCFHRAGLSREHAEKCALAYTYDLNKVHEVEKLLSDEQYDDYLSILADMFPMSDTRSKRRRVHSAEPIRRAEALVRLFGKWRTA